MKDNLIKDLERMGERGKLAAKILKGKHKTRKWIPEQTASGKIKDGGDGGCEMVSKCKGVLMDELFIKGLLEHLGPGVHIFKNMAEYSGNYIELKIEKNGFIAIEHGFFFDHGGG